MGRAIKPSDKFKNAAKDWLESHSSYICDRTVHDYHSYLKPLLRIFADVPLNKITLSAIREYQGMRKKGDPRTGAGKCIANERINAEVGTLRQILKEADLWKHFERLYKQLPINREGSGTSITVDEEKILMEIVFSKPKWLVKAHCLRLMLKTGCGFGEIRTLRRRDVDLENAQITINHEGAKNKHRERTVPLIPEALESATWLIERWVRLGGTTPEQYILPARNNHAGRMSVLGKAREYNLNAPAFTSFLARHWTDIRKIAVQRIGPKMKKFRIYDCRVTAITRTLSDGRTPLFAAQKVFGHVSPEMQKRYFKPDGDVLRKTLSALDTSAPAQPGPQTTREAAVALAEKANNILGGISVSALIRRMQRSGMTPEAILGILTDDTGAA